MCTCDGCVQMGELRVKFVAHLGEVATQQVKDRTKLPVFEHSDARSCRPLPLRPHGTVESSRPSS